MYPLGGKAQLHPCEAFVCIFDVCSTVLTKNRYYAKLGVFSYFFLVKRVERLVILLKLRIKASQRETSFQHCFQE